MYTCGILAGTGRSDQLSAPKYRKTEPRGASVNERIIIGRSILAEAAAELVELSEEGGDDLLSEEGVDDLLSVSVCRFCVLMMGDFWLAS